MNARQSELHDEEINLLDYWRVITRNKGIISGITGSVFVISILISLALTNIYASRTKIMAPQQGSGMSAAMGGMGGLASSLLGGKTSSVDTWMGILDSATIKDIIIKRFNLRELYKKVTIEDTRAKLGQNVSIKKSLEQIVTITVEDKDPQLACDMANAFVEELDSINRSMVMSSGTRTRMFLEKRLTQEEKKLEDAEEQLKEFQKKHGAIRLDAQSQAVLGSYSALKNSLVSKEVELQTLLSYATANNPQVELLQSGVRELNEQLRLMEQGRDTNLYNYNDKDTFIPFEKMPDLILQYGRLFRKVKVRETLYEMLVQQYEMARIQEAKDSPTIQVLDKAQVPEKKVKPKRGVIVIVSTFLAGFFAIAGVFIKESLDTMTEADRQNT